MKQVISSVQARHSIHENNFINTTLIVFAGKLNWIANLPQAFQMNAFITYSFLMSSLAMILSLRILLDVPEVLLLWHGPEPAFVQNFKKLFIAIAVPKMQFKLLWL